MSAPQGHILWITGLPASGKTTLASGLIERLKAKNVVTLWLDSDALREVLTPNATYAEAERDHFYDMVGHLAKLGYDGGCFVVVSATGSQKRYRDSLRQRAPNFTEIWLRASRTTLRERDFKGLYDKAAHGEAPELPGAGAGYEPPEHPDLVLDSDQHTPIELVEQVISHLGR